jgi:hypothetical protein
VHGRGNILLARDEMPDKNQTMTVTLQGKRISARTFGLSISIIDFTLSRINTGAFLTMPFLFRIHCAYILCALSLLCILSFDIEQVLQNYAKKVKP